MAGSTVWLEREVSTLLVRWLGRLSDWTPFGLGGGTEVCLTCSRYRASLQLAEVPHALVHPIASPIDDLVAHCFLTIAAERYDVLLEHGWSIALDNGLVRVGAPAVDGEEAPGPTPAAARLRLELTQLYTDLLGRAIYTVQQSTPEIAAALTVTVEPVVQRLAAELVEEVCGA
jgi:hypothetical protein